MTIEIIEKRLIENDDFPDSWSLYIEIDDGIDTYLLPVALPGTIAEGNLQSVLNAREAELWSLAQVKSVPPTELYTKLATNRVLKAFALVVLDEINTLRAVAALPARTEVQLRTAVKSKL